MPIPFSARWQSLVLALTCLGFAARGFGAEPAVSGLAFTLASPADYQVFQRASAGLGVIPIDGNWSLPKGSKTPPPTGAQARIATDGTAAGDSGWVTLPFDAGASGFRGSLPAPAGGWYHIQVRLLLAGSPQLVADVGHVGVGEVLVVAGQSNSANYGEVRQTPASGLVASSDGAAWRLSADPQPGAGGEKGSFIPALGDALVARLHVPVGFVCLGVGSTSVREWLPAHVPFPTAPTKANNTVAVAGGFESSGVIFERLVARLRQLGPGGARVVLWHQGESDWNQGVGHQVSPDQYQAMLRELIRGSRSAAGWDIPWMVAQASYHNPADPGSDSFRAAQRAVADDHLTFVGPNTDALPGSLREKNGQGVHFSAEGLTRHGQLWASVVGPWIEAQLAKGTAN